MIVDKVTTALKITRFWVNAGGGNGLLKINLLAQTSGGRALGQVVNIPIESR